MSNMDFNHGLKALFTENHINTHETVVPIALDKLIPNPYQPRRNFDSRALTELARSIKETGVFQPIIVRKAAHRSGYYEILAGERRCRASRMAGKLTVPAIVRNVANDQMMEIAVLENLQRENLTPLEEARAYYMLMKRLHLTQSQVSERLGKSRPYIANYLRLLKLPKPVKDLVQTRQLSMAKARILLSVRNQKLMIKIARTACRKHMTIRQIHEIISRRQPRKRKSIHKPKVKSPLTRAIEARLQDKFGTKVNIHSLRGHHGRHGKIEISFISAQDLNRILKLLKINLD